MNKFTFTHKESTGVMNFVVLLLFSEFVMQFSEICDRFCDAVGQELSLFFCVNAVCILTPPPIMPHFLLGHS